jgi:RES domain-containing protein
MITYRITLAKWAEKLSASGRAARWNSNGQFMLYTAGSRALACLENLVHRKSIGKDELFRITLLEIPDSLKIEKLNTNKLPSGWQEFMNYANCQKIGDAWLEKKRTVALQVPSATIPEEFNLLINPRHPDFSRIKLYAVEPFRFDERLLK